MGNDQSTTAPREPSGTRAAKEDQTRDRIVQAAADLLTEGGRGAVTTRAVASRVGVSPPMIFRLFGEKDGLLAAVAEYGHDRFHATKNPLQPSDDPVNDLRSAWSLAVEFGQNNPELFLLIYGEPRSATMTAAARTGEERMHARIQRVAAAGRLRVDETLAAGILQATARGAVLQWLDQPEDQRDPVLISAIREATISAITTETAILPQPGVAHAARALKANLPGQTSLSPSEHQLLNDWLDRLTTETAK
ncbi:TetR/AcrR family transcriptional regulator [Actinoallomurus rhizosphaericola]|uniref:TetR/AcrR family transcriptional regulator n=1 Tax=Actinoallomurus rhizosphaericola TaxID=2952536 RepID=UPI002092C5C5|nr:helix-turn-helix domain-containing protein [Actinoallomurus rhizosphaericola]MCO6000064.1 TetR/AcrR family transcriptional regulator [Actinoallomurus rhizosphaericola]